MKEYIKERMAFALALLGVLLALHPFLWQYKDVSFVIFDISFTFQHFFSIFGVLLGLSIYFYALQFIKHKVSQLTEALGNYLFLFALMCPAAYFLLYLVFLITISIQKISKIEEVRSAISILGVLIAIAASIYSFAFGKKELKRREVEEESSAKNKASIIEIDKANTMIEAGIYEPAVIHIFNSVMSQLRSLLITNMIIDKEVPDFQTIQLAKQKKLINKELMDKIHQLRLTRNQIVHASDSKKINISKNDITSYMQLAGEILSISTEEPFISGSPCQMSGQKCPACKEGVMNVAQDEQGVECSKCGLFIGTPPTSGGKDN